MKEIKTQIVVPVRVVFIGDPYFEVFVCDPDQEDGELLAYGRLEERSSVGWRWTDQSTLDGLARVVQDALFDAVTEAVRVYRRGEA